MTENTRPGYRVVEPGELVAEIARLNAELAAQKSALSESPTGTVMREDYDTLRSELRRVEAYAEELRQAALRYMATCPADPDINAEWQAAGKALIAALDSPQRLHSQGQSCEKCPDPVLCARNGKCDPDGGLSI